MRFERLGRYELLDELTRDDDGAVYKANDPLLGRQVSIKTIELGASSVDSDILELSFERKARLAGALTHPNIVIVYDMGRSDDVAYIATELLEGQTLRTMLDSGVPLPPGTIERIGAQVADGLDFMHQHRIVHGDVNPAAIVVLNIGIVKIAHVGNALFPVGSRASNADARALTRYMSPEQASGQPLDARSDVFSLGAVVYEMLTGVAPFAASDDQQLLDQIVNTRPAPPSSLNRNIPSGFDYIVAKAMSKDPEHRYQAARDMASELRKWSLEEATFFPTPLAFVSTATQSSPVVADETPVSVVPPDTPALLHPSTQQQPMPVASGGSLTRRQWLLYGIPTALLAVTGGWTMLSRRAPSPVIDDVATASEAPAPMKLAPMPMPELALPPIAESAAVPATDVPAATAPKPSEPVRIANGDRPRARVAESVRAPVVIPGRVAPSVRRVARLGFAVSPWGEIYVDGRRRGISPPLREIELPPGRYLIEIRNTAFPARRQAIDLSASSRLRIKHKFK